MVELKYFKLYRDVEDLSFATPQSACLDVKAYFGTQERLIKTFDKTGKSFNHLAIKQHDNDIYHFNICPGDRCLIPTGMILDIPAGYSVRVHPRSGLAFKKGLSLTNCEGIIDSDYVEQLYISVINLSEKKIRIDHGERISQLELVQHPVYNVGTIDYKPENKTNRNGGFGSTGV